MRSTHAAPQLALALTLIFVGINPAHQVNPGLELRLSQAGLNYAANVAIDEMTKDIKGKHIDDQSGMEKVAVGKVEYSLTQMTVTEFGTPQSVVTVNPGSGITWSLSALSAAIHGYWRYKYRKAFIKISDKGSFDVSTRGASLSVSVTLGVDGAGRPTIHMNSCSSGGGDVKVKFHRGASWLYNIFRDQVEKPLRKKIQEMLCSAAGKAINKKAVTQLAKMKVQVPIKNLGTLDYRLVAPPVFATQLVTSQHKGEFYWTGNATEAPFQVPVMPAPPGSTRMIGIGVSQYVLDTLGYVCHEGRLLRYNLTQKDLRPKSAVVLNVTCTSGVCIGSFILQLRKLYPDGVVELAMESTSYPRLLIASGSLKGVFQGQIKFNVRLPSGELKYAFQADVVANMTLAPFVQGQKIAASVTSWETDIQIKNSKIGPVSATNLDVLMTTVFDRFVKPKLNEIGEKGLDIPAIDDVSFDNPTLNLIEGALYLQTDLKYTPDTTLFYQG